MKTRNKTKILQKQYIKEGIKRANMLKREATKEGEFYVNTFYHYAEEFLQGLTKDEEIKQIDFTQKFWSELMIIPLMEELINMNVNAPPASGKSLTAMAIAQEIKVHIFRKVMNIHDIDRDQQEFSQIMRDANVKQTIRVIDEWNELENTGENVTVERALYNYFSDVMAQRFVHKISCSPTESPDRNAQIYLTVLSSDRINKINHCELAYKMFYSGTEIIQPLGYVNIYVGDILTKPWYQLYRKRKFEKMDLILKKGIFRPRMLDYAGIILKVVEALKKMTKMASLVSPNIIRNYIKKEARLAKIPQSIIGEELATREAQGILDFYKSFWLLTKKIEKSDSAMNKQPELKQIIQEDTQQMLEMRDEIIQAIKLQEDELIEYRKIFEKYKNV